MTRTEFMKAYAKRSELSDEWALLGFVEADKRIMVATPCACGEQGCEGWAMLSPENISHHLAFQAPEKLREVYREALGDLIA